MGRRDAGTGRRGGSWKSCCFTFLLASFVFFEEKEDCDSTSLQSFASEKNKTSLFPPPSSAHPLVVALFFRSKVCRREIPIDRIR